GLLETALHDSRVAKRVGGHLEVLEDRHLGEDLTALGNVGEPLFQRSEGGKMGDVGSVEYHAPRSRLHDPHNRLEKGRLAAAVGADNPGYAASFGKQAHVVDDRLLGIARGQAGHLQNGITHPRKADAWGSSQLA